MAAYVCGSSAADEVAGEKDEAPARSLWLWCSIMVKSCKDLAMELVKCLGQSDGKAWDRRKLQGVLRVEAAEACAARLALELAKDMGYERIILQGDCWNFIKGLHNKDQRLSEYGGLLDNVSRSLEEYTDVRKEANSLAHRLCQELSTNARGYGFINFQFEKPN